MLCGMSPGEALPSAFFTDATSNRAVDCCPNAAHAVSAPPQIAIPIFRPMPALFDGNLLKSIEIGLAAASCPVPAITDADGRSEEADSRGAGLPQTGHSLLRHHHQIERSRRAGRGHRRVERPLPAS